VVLKEKHPVWTKAITSFVLSFVSSLTAQLLKNGGNIESSVLETAFNFGVVSFCTVSVYSNDVS
jgi:hypothetical protein